MSALDLVDSWPVPTAAVAVVDAHGVRDRHGPDTALPWASVTKLLTALTVLVAVDRGDVLLDEPAGPAEGATVRHLLAHTSGVAFDEDSRSCPRPAANASTPTAASNCSPTSCSPAPAAPSPSS